MRNPERVLRRAEVLRTRGFEHAENGALAAAEHALRKAARLYQRVLETASYPMITLVEGVMWNQALTLWRLANVVSVGGRFGEAVGHCSQAADAMERHLDRHWFDVLAPRPTTERITLGSCLTDLSIFHCAQGWFDDATSSASRAVDLFTEEDDEQRLATAYHVLAQAHLADGAPNRANAAIRDALIRRERAADADPGATLATYELASSLLLRAQIYAARDDRMRALGHVERVEGMLDDLGPTAAPLWAKAQSLRPQLER